MTSKFKKIIAAATIALGTFGAVAATSTAAQADVRGGIHFSGPGFSVGFGDFGYDRGPRYRYRDYRYDRGPRYGRHFCRPGKAIRKAERRGIRRAHIVRSGRRGIVVAGRKWGERVVIGFRNNHRCSIRFVRAR